MEDVEKQHVNKDAKFDWLKEHRWQKGESGNPKGRPKGKTMKEFAREFLMNMSDESKVEYLKTIDGETVWKMADGNPHTTTDNKVEVTLPTPILGGTANEVHSHNSITEDSGAQKAS